MPDIGPPYMSVCDCGEVEFQALNAPAFNVVCYCTDCQSAEHSLQSDMGCNHLTDPDGGTPYSAFMDADWICIKGAEKLKEHKLTPDSSTSRFVTSCCQSAMYLKYEDGFWTSTYRQRFINPLPPLKWRIKTKRRLSNLPFPDKIQRFKGFPLRLYFALYRAKLAASFAGSHKDKK